MDILQTVFAAHDALPIPLQEARALALACVLEPLSEKSGCVTRTSNTPNGNTLEMFLAGATNIFPSYVQLATFVHNKGSAQGMYQFFPQAILLSKYQRLGGQINLGIIEFSFPLLAARILAKDKNNLDSLFSTAQAIIDTTTPEDLAHFLTGKRFGREITLLGRGKTYDLVEHSGLATVRDYYQAEFTRETNQGGRLTALQHNLQFLQAFPTLRETFHYFQQAQGTVSQRSAEAYTKITTKPQYLGIGPGLVADFIALSLYLELCMKREQFIG